MRPIDADELLKDPYITDESIPEMHDAIMAINEAKTIKTTINGEWVPSNIPCEKYVCSICGGACWHYDFGGNIVKSRFCPNCGAKMKNFE